MTASIVITLAGSAYTIRKQIADLYAEFCGAPAAPAESPVVGVETTAGEIVKRAAADLMPPKKRGRPKKDKPAESAPVVSADKPEAVSPDAGPAEGAQPATDPAPAEEKEVGDPAFFDPPDFLKRETVAKPITLEDVRGWFQKLGEVKPLAYCREFIVRFGVDRISKLPEEKFAEFVIAVQKEMGE